MQSEHIYPKSSVFDGMGGWEAKKARNDEAETAEYLSRKRFRESERAVGRPRPSNRPFDYSQPMPLGEAHVYCLASAAWVDRQLGQARLDADARSEVVDRSCVSVN